MKLTLVAAAVVAATIYFFSHVSAPDPGLGCPNLDLDTSASTTQFIETQRQQIDELTDLVGQLSAEIEFLRSNAIDPEPTPDGISTPEVYSYQPPPRQVSKDSLIRSGLAEGDAAIAAGMINEAYAAYVERLQQDRSHNREVQSQIREWLQTNIGEHAYDSYLFATAQRNRLVIREVREGSPAAEEGLRAQDIIHSINGRRVFGNRDIQELQSNTTDIGHLVEVEVVREGQVLNFYLPLARLGIQMASLRVNPSEYPVY